MSRTANLHEAKKHLDQATMLLAGLGSAPGNTVAYEAAAIALTEVQTLINRADQHVLDDLFEDDRRVEAK